MNNYIELVVTCGEMPEAVSIADVLLNMHLVVCVKFETIHSKYWWHGMLEESDEVKLSMLSNASYFDAIEAEIAKLHTYDIFVLQASQISHISKDAAHWLSAGLSK